jgi:hypothetical protein
MYRLLPQNLQGPFTINVLNTSARTPGNPEAHDPALRARLYNETLKTIREVRPATGMYQSCQLDTSASKVPHAWPSGTTIVCLV